MLPDDWMENEASENARKLNVNIQQSIFVL